VRIRNHEKNNESGSAQTNGFRSGTLIIVERKGYRYRKDVIPA
jgi:hypothetical protein